jgi:urease accessory protein
MKKRTQFSLAVLSICLLLPAAAFAHPNGVAASGFGAGFAHPFSGVDHVLAMVAVGLWAVQMGGRAMWMMPLAFVSLMIGGGLLAFTGIPIPYAETGILLSVVILGALIAVARKWPLSICAAIAGGFALFHGYAHVSELSIAQALAPYILGFVLATVFLLAIGMAAGAVLRTLHVEKALRLAGGVLAMGGTILGLVS